VDLLISLYPTSKNIAVDFELKMNNIISKADRNWSSLVAWLATDQRYVWIDYGGNTALIALLTRWACGQNEPKMLEIINQLVRLGAEDRNGETALPIATR
jgi:hypothetical protein